jgi:hypothetical protein
LALIFDVSPVSSSSLDLSQFLVAAWARHSDLIPNEIGGIVPEPVEPFVERAPPLFISTSEVVHSRCDMLQFHIFIRVLEVHDYSIVEGSDDDPSDCSDDFCCNGLLRPPTGSSLCPWPHIYWVAGDRVLPSGESWPSLPSHGGGGGGAIAWCLSPPMEAYVNYALERPAKSCVTWTGRANERSTWPTSPVRFDRNVTAPHVRVGMDCQIANACSTTRGPSDAGHWAKGCLKQPDMTAAPTVTSASPASLGAGHVSDPTLVGSRVQL